MSVKTAVCHYGIFLGGTAMVQVDDATGEVKITQLNDKPANSTYVATENPDKLPFLPALVVSWAMEAVIKNIEQKMVNIGPEITQPGAKA